MKSNRKTKAITFSGLATAMTLVLFFLASIIDVLDYTVSAICGLVVTFILVEFGTKSALCVYFASSILSLIILPSKTTVLLFVAFCGWYPFIKRYLERLREPFCIIIKFLVFNLSLALIIYLTKKFFVIEHIPTVGYIILCVVSNITFVLYDVLITKTIWLYVHKYRKKLTFLNK